ncbi:hypothetical protein JCM19240_2765 [Vibrio maritimus]|uniref:Uncharacterized protein n=1 Tax=Vibrio maritimus TaxID=990268 RepID=A0A090T9S9_9VIBR|nr:hypothetical protein JCM19240_2765 [Vibrio maritimus]
MVVGLFCLQSNELQHLLIIDEVFVVRLTSCKRAFKVLSIKLSLPM